MAQLVDCVRSWFLRWRNRKVYDCGAILALSKLGNFLVSAPIPSPYSQLRCRDISNSTCKMPSFMDVPLVQIDRPPTLATTADAIQMQ